MVLARVADRSASMCSVNNQSVACGNEPSASGADGTGGCVGLNPTTTLAVTVAQICRRRDQLRQLTSEKESQQASVPAVREQAERQESHLQAAQKAAGKRAAERDKVAKELEATIAKRAALTQQVGQIRQRDTVLQYWELLNSKPEAEALQYLQIMAPAVPEPWKVVTEVARLRDYLREQVNRRRKESASAAQLESRARHQHELQ